MIRYQLFRLRAVLMNHQDSIEFILFSMIIGALVQTGARLYIKTHPKQFPPDRIKTRFKYKSKFRMRKLVPRGGEFVAGLTLFQTTIIFLSEHAIPVITSFGSIFILAKKIPRDQVSRVLRQALLNHSPFVFPGDENVNRLGAALEDNVCDEGLGYLLTILEDERIPYQQRREIIRDIFRKFFDLGGPGGRQRLILCLAYILYILYTLDCLSSYHLLLEAIKKARDEGMLSEEIVRLIKRRVQRKNRKLKIPFPINKI